MQFPSFRRNLVDYMSWGLQNYQFPKVSGTPDHGFNLPTPGPANALLSTPGRPCHPSLRLPAHDEVFCLFFLGISLICRPEVEFLVSLFDPLYLGG